MLALISAMIGLHTASFQALEYQFLSLSLEQINGQNLLQILEIKTISIKTAIAKKFQKRL